MNGIFVLWPAYGVFRRPLGFFLWTLPLILFGHLFCEVLGCVAVVTFLSVFLSSRPFSW